MKIPRYWAKENASDANGGGESFWAWGWSFENVAAAKDLALARAWKFRDAFTQGQRLDNYDYPESPLREEIIESVGPEGAESILITRNRYGALILNCRDICFADVDFDQPLSPGFLDSLLLLFSAARREERARAAEAEALGQVREWHRKNSGSAVRIYRTAAGFRLLFTDRTYSPTAPETDTLFDALGTDPLYRRLTTKQECFRARLTPKPWRCGLTAPPNRYPWEEEGAEDRYRAWVQTYEAETKRYAVCRLVEVLGSDRIEEPMASVVALHDEYTASDRDAELA